MFMAILVFVCLHVLMGFRKRTYSAWLSAYVIRSYYVSVYFRECYTNRYALACLCHSRHLANASKIISAHTGCAPQRTLLKYGHGHAEQ